ncbi:PTS lactose/cellobiose transporter subunit IIA, partial [Escherichia coli]|uniref:PTS lactose/cellobiose transporter subunit IIA n=1 Tax=Escherichia coli TaxID=562 RepID=UPI001FCF205B
EVTWKIRSWKTGKVPFRTLLVYKSQDEGCGKIKVNLILIHAQDHLMNAILCQDLAREIISLRKELHA